MTPEFKSTLRWSLKEGRQDDKGVPPDPVCMAGAPGGEMVVYEDPGGEIRVDVRLERETVWLSLGQLAELFGRDKSVISRHLRNVFASGELERTATVAKNATVQREGDREVARETEFFNLDAILSVGYRVNSKRGTPDRLFRDGETVINDVGLAALALLVAESLPKDKEVMVRLVMNMLTGPQQ